jgi:hypothetical protein
MKPKIDHTKFGSITIDGKIFQHDVLIRLDGCIKKRKKKLSKAIYGTSHTISLDEAKYICEIEVEKLIIGTGQYGMVNLSEEATAFFKKQNCDVEMLPSPEAIHSWNKAQGFVSGLFHVTC